MKAAIAFMRDCASGVDALGLPLVGMTAINPVRPILALFLLNAPLAFFAFLATVAHCFSVKDCAIPADDPAYNDRMGPAQAQFLLDFLLPQLKSEQAITTKILSSIPADRGDYKPDAKCMSALKLAGHIAVTEIWFLDAVISRQFGETAPLPDGAKTGRDIAQWYEENFANRMPLLEALSGEELATPVDFLGLRNDPAVAYLNIAIRHSVHHRGQLSAYLRPMGAKVPAIYVESADEPFPPTGECSTTAIQQRPPAF
jgi:uncharacterized damage-inducible protein DinB